MNKIAAIRLSYLRNNAHDQFMYVFNNLVKAFPAVMTVVSALYPEFERLFTLEERLVNAIVGSDFTLQLADTDARIDRTVSGINSIVNAGIHHFNPTVVEAAKRVRICMNAFGNIEEKPYKEEASAVRILVTDLRSEYSVEIVVLALVPWVDELAMAGTDFDTLFRQRNAEWSDRPTEKLKDVRREVDAVYRPMTARISAAALMDDTGAFDEFILRLNREIKYFVDHTHHQTRRDIACINATSIASQTATGKHIMPVPQLFYPGEGKDSVELLFSVDFDLTYKNNIKPGTATIIVHGKGAYRGMKSFTFNIVPAVQVEEEPEGD